MRKYNVPSTKFTKTNNKVEILKSLSENFGSKYGVPENRSSEHHKMNFQLDRLFTVVHDN